MPERMSHQVSLRPAGLEDCRRVWEWRNDEVTREASFYTNYIPYEEHERWFSRKLTDPHFRIFIAVDSQGHELGYLRFDITEGQAEVSVSIDKNERGKGYGPAVIKRGSQYLMASEPVRRIVAYIKRDNPASMIAFERAGFALGGFKQIGDVEAYEMIYEGSASTGTRAKEPRSPD